MRNSTPATTNKNRLAFPVRRVCRWFMFCLNVRFSFGLFHHIFTFVVDAVVIWFALTLVVVVVFFFFNFYFLPDLGNLSIFVLGFFFSASVLSMGLSSPLWYLTEWMRRASTSAIDSTIISHAPIAHIQHFFFVGHVWIALDSQIFYCNFFFLFVLCIATNSHMRISITLTCTHENVLLCNNNNNNKKFHWIPIQVFCLCGVYG